jgi:tetratricopeptide (TPR) repeat protein
MCDGDGKLLASHDLSIVQTWDDFSDSETMTKSRLTLTRVEGIGTSGATANALTQLLTQSGVVDILNTKPGGGETSNGAATAAGPDILHVEAHGDDTTHQVGGVSSTRFAQQYGQPRMAMLWSCFSGAANSWGDSPALWLHRDGAAMVLSFQAELHVLDAASLTQSFYSEVFGPAASRDPETALVHARCAKFNEGFQNACWASMTVYLRSPLDLSALPLNGPRVPQSQWNSSPAPSLAPPVVGSSSFGPPTPTMSRYGYSTPQAANSYGAALNAAASMDSTSENAVEDSGKNGDDAGSSPDGASLSRDDSPARGDREVAPASTSTVGDSGVEGDEWATVEHEVCKMQPGSWKLMNAPTELAERGAKLPIDVFGGWRGNVIRLDGGENPVTREILSELDLLNGAPMNANAADKLVWFFKRIRNFGSPLIVWTNCQPRHMEFLKVVVPSPSLTFLLLIGPTPEETIPVLVDENRLDEARELSAKLPADTPDAKVPDEILSAAYYACVRGAQPELAKEYLQRIDGFQEWLLLMGNLYSRDDSNILSIPELMAIGSRFLTGDCAATRQEEFQLLRKPEDFYRLAMNQPTAASSPRENARAKHELGYLLQDQGQPSTAEAFYRLALTNLESCDESSEGTRHDSRWYFALSTVLRDLADLLSEKKSRVKDATELMKRAMAIQAFRGMRLQLAYSETTAARISLTEGEHTRAIDHALRAANRMEECVNWTGWGKALGIFFDSLAETRETARMISLANLANEKIRASNLSAENIARLERTFKFAKAKAHWIAGDLTEARDELEDIHRMSDADQKGAMDREIDRLLTFLRVTRNASEAPHSTHTRKPH